MPPSNHNPVISQRMSAPIVGAPAPDFRLPATSGRTLGPGDFPGRNLVVYFYPRDATPGCTTESQDFRDAHDDFEAAGTAVLGISQDTIDSHEKFKTRQSLAFELLSDTEGTVCRAYDVIRQKKMFGKAFAGIERSTFLIDKSGVLRQEWRKVKVKGHVEAVLQAARALA